MPRHGSLVLSDLASATVGLACDKCGRKGRYRVAGLSQRKAAKALGVDETTIRRDLRQGAPSRFARSPRL